MSKACSILVFLQVLQAKNGVAFVSNAPSRKVFTGKSLHASPMLSESNLKETKPISSTSSIEIDIDDKDDIMEALPKESNEYPTNIGFLEQSESPTKAQKDVGSKQVSHRQIPKNLPKLSELLSNMSTPYKHPNRSSSVNQREKDISKKDRNIEVKSKHSSEINPSREPWKADYLISRNTQAKIRAVVSFSNDTSHERNGEGSKVDKLRTSIRILSVLIDDTLPENCNEVNVLHALTLSAKIYPPPLSPEEGFTAKEQALRMQFRSKLVDTLKIVSELVSDRRLNGRQLTNAAWAIVRHHITNSALENHGNKDDIFFSSQDIEELLDSIALQLIERSPSSTLLNDNMTEKEPTLLKPAELSMAAWAYAMAKPRNCPTGWSFPPQETRIPPNILRKKNKINGMTSSEEDRLKQTQQKQRDEIVFEETLDFATFSDDGADMNVNTIQVEEEIEMSTVDMLFDSIAKSFLVSDYNKRIQDGLDMDDSNKHRSLLQKCTWKELSNLAWSFATHGLGRNPSKDIEAFLIALAKEANGRLFELQNVDSMEKKRQLPLPRDLSTLAWSLGVLQVDNYRLSKYLADFIDAIALTISRVQERPFEEWKSADIVQLGISLAHGRIDHKSLLHELFAEALLKIESEDESLNNYKGSFQSWELSVLLWVQAKLHLTSHQGKIYEKFAHAVVDGLAHRLQKIDIDIKDMDISRIGIGSQEQANLAWSLTVLELYTPDSITLLQSIFAAASSVKAGTDERAGSFIKLEHAHQLWQALFILRADCPEAVQHVPSSFGKFLNEKWDDEKSREKKSSHRHRALSQTLDFMRVAHYNEHDDDIDIAIVLKEPNSEWTHAAKKYNKNDKKEECSNPKVAVEFDGPTHFTRISDENIKKIKGEVVIPRALGHTVIKYRMLKIKGWTVVRVPYYEFDKIPFWASMVSLLSLIFSL